MTGERKTELDKDALEKAREAFWETESDQIKDIYASRYALNAPLEAAILAYLTALPQSALSSRLLWWARELSYGAYTIEEDGTIELEGLLRKAAALGGIPEGWKLVPVEPTEAMLHAGWLQTGESYEMADRTYDRLKRHYEVMLAAAPPLTPGEQK